MSRAVADHVVVTLSGDQLLHTPDAVDDVTASTLPIAPATASAALAAAQVHDGDTVLIGGAAGGVGVFAVQPARLAGARVLATSSEGSFEFLRSLGAEPIRYGEGLVDRVRAAAPGGIDAAADLHGTETAYAALALKVPAERISTIAAQDPDLHVQATSETNAEPGTLEHVASLVAQGRLVVPIAARYPVEQIRDGAPHPAVLMRTPYFKEQRTPLPTADPRRATARGYAWSSRTIAVAVARRGRSSLSSTMSPRGPSGRPRRAPAPS
jgi:NADPH:quinone reductase-like Zn-dependent oxidoreductase